MKISGHKLFYILAVSVAVVVYLSASNIKTIFRLNRRISFYEDRLEMLKKENQQIENELKWIKTEDDYIKYLAMKELGLVSPGEIKYYLVIENK